MLTLDLWFFLIAGPAVVFAGISKGGFGSGAAFAASSVLALVVEPGLALGVMLPLLMLIDVSTLRPYWGRWHLREAGLVIAGALPGIALGAALYRIASPDVLRLLIGLVSVGFVLWQISVKRGWLRFGARHMPDPAGLVAGLAVFLLSRGLGKTGYQATSVLIFWAVNIAKFIPYAFLGMFTLETAQANLVLAPFAVLGAWIGVRAHHAVPERAFFALTYILLTITGLKLIWDGLT